MAHGKTTMRTTAAQARTPTVTVPKAEQTPRRSRHPFASRRPAVLRSGVACVLLAAPALAVADQLDSGDTAWMITATALVLFMTIPGLALFYAGMVRSKNVLSMFMQCFAITSLVSILWVIYAYSLAFDEGNALRRRTSARRS